MNDLKEKNHPNKDLDETIINLVIARLKAVPSNAVLTIGTGEDQSGFKITDLIAHVRNKTDIGRQIVESQLLFLRSLGNLPTSDDAFVDN